MNERLEGLRARTRAGHFRQYRQPGGPERPDCDRDGRKGARPQQYGSRGRQPREMARSAKVHTASLLPASVKIQLHNKQ